MEPKKGPFLLGVLPQNRPIPCGILRSCSSRSTRISWRLCRWALPPDAGAVEGLEDRLIVRRQGYDL